MGYFADYGEHRGVPAPPRYAAPEAKVKELAEEFRRLAEYFWLQSKSGELLSYSVGIREGQAKAYMQAAQMLEERLDGDVG